jgi:hypothetical protein
MLQESGKPWKPWRALSPNGKRKRVLQLLTFFERRRLREPIPKTTGEWWRGSGHSQVLAFFVYSVLETNGNLRMPDGTHFP